MGKRDELRGPKENVIVGRLIPAGTGLATTTMPGKAQEAGAIWGRSMPGPRRKRL